MLSLVFIILLVVSSVSAGYAILKILSQRKHLTDIELRSISRIRPNHRDYGRIIGHLGQCEKCRQRMEDLEKNIDHLVED